MQHSRPSICRHRAVQRQVCHEKLGLGLRDLKGIAVNGFAVADVSSEIRDHWINEIESLSKKHGIS